MRFARRLVPRLITLVPLALAAIVGTGDLALPDEHFLQEDGAIAGQVATVIDAHHDSQSPSGDHPAHTCHCVHAHGLAVVAGERPFRVEAPARSAFPEHAIPAIRPGFPPPFHPPKNLS